MTTNIIEPQINEQHRYAIALPFSNGDGKIIGVSLIATYPTLEDLEQGYAHFERFAEGRGISQPVRIEKTKGIWHGKNECQLL